jgi:geranylgeranylglycerol-phosphate geranylgeranyltransferase
MFFVGVFVGGVVAVGADAFLWRLNSPLILAAVSATFVGAGGNVLNDLRDIEVDRINRPSRPLPAGVVGISHAKILWAALVLAGVATAFLVSIAHVLIALFSVILIAAYNLKLKSSPLVGNIVVSSVVAAALVYGGLSMGGVIPTLPAVVFAFLTTLARELLKDVEDLKGDSSVGMATYAVVRGPEAVGRMAAAILLATVALTVTPFLLLGYSGTYLMLIMLADGMMLFASWNALGQNDPDSVAAASRWTKLAMIAGLAGLALANVTLL